MTSSARGGWHIPFKRPAHLAATDLRGGGTLVKISDIRPLAEGEEDGEVVGFKNRGYCVAPGSILSTATGNLPYLLMTDPPAPHEAPEGLLDLIKLKVIEVTYSGQTGTSDKADVAKLVAELDMHGEFSTEPDWWKYMGAIKLALGDTEDGVEVALQMTADDATAEAFWSRWNRLDSVDNGGLKCRVGSMIHRYKELTGKHFNVRTSISAMFPHDIIAGAAGMPPVPTVESPSIVPEGQRPANKMPTDGESKPAVSTELRTRRINVASLEGKPVPDREWLARDLVPAKNVTLLYGDGGTGKSLLALQLGVALVTGRPFFTHLVKQGRVEFITAEDSLDEMHRRLVDVAQATGTPLSALSGLHITSLAEVDAMLAVAQDARGGALAMTALYHELESVIAESRPALVVLDTLADVFGGNEIIRAQARQFIGMLRKLCLQYDCTIVVLAHPSLSGMEKGTSGSTGWNNSVRSRLSFRRIHEKDGSELDEDARVLHVGKSNYGRVGLEIRMQWRGGVFAHTAGGGGDPMAAAEKADNVFLELLAKARAQNINVHVQPGKGYAADYFKGDASQQGVSKTDLAAAMKRLLDAGKIENAPFGPQSRIRYRLQLAGGA
jgi:RecA-family ATPase